MNELPAWSVAAIAKMQEYLRDLAPAMAGLAGAANGDEQVAQWLDERRSRLQASLRDLPQIAAQTGLDRFISPGDLALLLTKGQDQFCLVVMLSPPQVSPSCPSELRYDLPLELVEELRPWLQDIGKTYPVEFYGNLIQLPLTDSALTSLHQVLAPLPTLILYSTFTNRKLYSHLAFWWQPQPSLMTCALTPWAWEENWYQYQEQGFSERRALAQIGQQVVVAYQWFLKIAIFWYFAHLYPIAEETLTDWPQAIVPGFRGLLTAIDTQRQQLRKVQQQRYMDSARQRHAQLAPTTRRIYLGQTLPTPRCIVYGLGFWPEQNWLVIGGSAQFLQVWDLSQRRNLATLKGHEGDVLSLAIEPKQGLLATSGSEGIVQVWNMTHLRLVHRFRHESHPIRSLSMEPTGRFLAGASLEGRCWLWDLWTGVVFREWSTATAGALAFGNHDQNLWVAQIEGGLELWRVATGQRQGLVTTPPLRQLHRSPDGSLLASLDRKGWGYLLDSSTGLLRHQLPTNRTDLTCLAFSKTGKVLAGGDKHGWIYLWDVQFGQLLHRFRAHDYPIAALAFDRDVRLASGSSWQQPIYIWEFEQDLAAL